MIYRTCFTDSQQGEAIAAYAWYWRKLLRLAILISDDEQASYSRNVARAAANAFTELGGEVVQMVEFQGDREEFAKKLRDLVAYNPQAILVPAEPDNAGVLVKYIRELGYRGLLLGPESWDEREFFSNCGADPGDCAFVGLYSEEYDLPEQLAFRDLFRRTYFVFPVHLRGAGVRCAEDAGDRARQRDERAGVQPEHAAYPQRSGCECVVHHEAARRHRPDDVHQNHPARRRAGRGARVAAQPQLQHEEDLSAQGGLNSEWAI